MNKPVQPIEILGGIYWTGALNPELKRFDVVMETKYGTSYNCYLVQGTEKTALIDTVKDGHLNESLHLLRQLADPSQIDYIILQHTEPDHSGSIAELASLAPNAKILCTKPASLYLPHIANRQLNMGVVKEGDKLDLGGHVLRFIMAPFLHWPDTMFTYDESTGALFTCDAFGCHYAAEHVLESKTESTFKEARRYYYDCIVSPFAPHVLKAIAHINELNLPCIKCILPSHGPVLDADPLGAVVLYHEWARENPPLTGNKAFIGYVSCYGYTRQLAEALKARLLEKGMEADLADLAEIPPGEALARMLQADCIAIGTPTVNGDSLPPIWAALSHLPVPLMRGRAAVAFGSYGWSGEAVPMVEQRLTSLGLKMQGSVKTRFRPNEEAIKEMHGLADALFAALPSGQ